MTNARIVQAPPPPRPTKRASQDDSPNPSPAKRPSPQRRVASHTKHQNGGDAAMQSAPSPSDRSSVLSDSEWEVDEEAPVVHVEVRLRPNSADVDTFIITNVAALLREEYMWLSPGIVPEEKWNSVHLLQRAVERIYVAECGSSEEGEVCLAEGATIEVHVYRTTDAVDDMQTDDYDDDDKENTSPAMIRHLPSAHLEDLWEHLIYEEDVKDNLLEYIDSTMLFSDNNVNSTIISWNRLALLYGPPGTGKTSLCQALAQKLLIRLSGQFSSGRLVEINSHSLFSKWFSESGKLVQRLFDELAAMVADEYCFVVVMIDEVESLTAARAGAMTGSEPSDALRVVNALLTQLDKLKEHPNVLVLATSNLAGSIDPAFIDRADIKQFIGLPPPEAIYWILSGCLAELGRNGLAPGGQRLLTWRELKDNKAPRHDDAGKAERVRLASHRLKAIADRCHAHGFSGRFLRRAPLMAHAKYLRGKTPPVDKWVDALERAVTDEINTRALIAVAEGKRGSKETERERAVREADEAELRAAKIRGM